MKVKGRYIILGCVALALLACTHSDKTPQEIAPLRVKTMVVAPHDSSAATRYVGTIEPERETPLSMQSAGRVVTIEVKNGQTVRTGQTILTIDNTQAMNALRSAEATLKHAQDGYNRVKSVHAKGVVSDQKMVEIESQLAQAKSLYAAAKQQLAECTLKAPCDGIMDGLKAEKGQTLIPGAKVCSILDVSSFSVRFTVPEGEIKGLTGERISELVECAAVDTVLPIEITEKSVTANPVTHTYDVVAKIKGGKEILMNGMVAKVMIHGGKHQSSEEIVVPAGCILLKPEGPTVWVVEQGEAVRREITTGGYLSSGVRVTSGLNPGDSLIVEGYQKLYKGCKVIEN